MALYVAICLLAALIAVPEDDVETHVYKLIWGVTIGLAVVHWFAFRLSAQLVGEGRVGAADSAIGGAQLGGAAAVALAATIPALILEGDAEYAVVEGVLCAIVAVIGFAVAREGHAGRVRSALYAATVVLVAIAIAVAKNALAGH